MIPRADLRNPPAPLWLDLIEPMLFLGALAWPIAAVLEVLHLFGVVSQTGPIVVTLIPVFPVAVMIYFLSLIGFFGSAVPTAWRALKHAWASDLVRKRRVRRRVRRSTNRGDLLRYWHRAHSAALSAGDDPAEAVRRADEAVLRP